MKYNVEFKKYQADTVTPVSVFLKLRDRYTNPLLLESSDYNSNKNSFTFIALEPLEFISIANDVITINNKEKQIEENSQVKEELKKFIDSIEVEQTDDTIQFNGLYGYTGFEAVKYFDTLKFDKKPGSDSIPDMHYSFYRYIIAINHFNDDLIIMENIPEGENATFEDVEKLVFSQKLPEFDFRLDGKEISNIEDNEFIKLVKKGKHYCKIGEVFQIVFSRRYKQPFLGDEFNVYRALRSINPSPYLFYFDYGDFKLFGSSPESQLVIARGEAKLNPIAGTYKKTGIEIEDEILAKKLSEDPKENAEHTMLVDLARNDLSRFCKDVKVEKYKEIQHFSHVIHIVSEVSGKVDDKKQAIDIFGATFPAGTLSGAPKYRALELIHKDEKYERSFYGGTIGIISLSGDINTAITIRSILSQNGVLQYQAGAGIVVDSVPESELKEVDNKLGALRKAIKMANNK
ncbi:MAG TPA: anthranilate synthase component I family protein [Bacteroidetes bacterium]|nr:anthranilate synthase component I family protein [Bacteroidota bacterium]